MQLQPLGDGLLVLGSNEPIALYSPGVEWEIVDDGGHETARAVVDLAAAGGTVVLELRLRHAQPGAPPARRSTERQAAAEQPWRDWAGHAAAAADRPGPGRCAAR